MLGSQEDVTQIIMNIKSVIISYDLWHRLWVSFIQSVTSIYWDLPFLWIREICAWLSDEIWLSQFLAIWPLASHLTLQSLIFKNPSNRNSNYVDLFLDPHRAHFFQFCSHGTVVQKPSLTTHEIMALLPLSYSQLFSMKLGVQIHTFWAPPI